MSKANEEAQLDVHCPAHATKKNTSPTGGIFFFLGRTQICDAKKVGGEKYQWHFARQASLANLFAKKKLRARRMWASPNPNLINKYNKNNYKNIFEIIGYSRILLGPTPTTTMSFTKKC